MKKFCSTKMGFFSVAVLFIWLKSYLVYLFEFNLGIQNGMQQFILFFNPLSSALILLGVALFARGRRLGLWVTTIYTFMSLLLYANVVFYRFNSDFITLPVLTQTSNFGSLGESIMSLVALYDIFYFLDIIILVIIYQLSKKSWSHTKLKLRKPAIIIAVGILAFMINLNLAEKDRPQLLER